MFAGTSTMNQLDKIVDVTGTFYNSLIITCEKPNGDSLINEIHLDGTQRQIGCTLGLLAFCILTEAKLV